MSNQTETSSGETVIEISNVWKIFGTQADAALRAIQEEGLGKAEVLETYNAVVGVADVSFEVKKGEIFCVMGLSGSGKSTLVRHFNRLLEPTSGKIVIHGTDVMGLGTQDLMDFRNRKIGMVFQNFALLPHRSVLDNVAMPTHAPRGQYAEDGRARRLGQQIRARVVRRHAATRRARAGARRRPGRVADGRAIQRARPVDPTPAAG
jgi:ABC-type proline/glycine betaine transport system ATPase subunit